MTAEAMQPSTAPAATEVTMTMLPDRLTRQATPAWDMSRAVMTQMGPVICQCRGTRRPSGMSTASAMRFLCAGPRLTEQAWGWLVDRRRQRAHEALSQCQHDSARVARGMHVRCVLQPLINQGARDCVAVCQDGQEVVSHRGHIGLRVAAHIVEIRLHARDLG